MAVKAYPLSMLVMICVTNQWAVAESVKEESLKLIADDVKSNGKTVPKGAERKLKDVDKKSPEEIDPEVLILPKVEVTTPRMTDLDRKLAGKDREQARETNSVKPTTLDLFLNRGNARARAAKAAKRVEIMDWERMLTIALTFAKTPEERAQIELEIKMLKGLRR
jgi:hypothetical protein